MGKGRGMNIGRFTVEEGDGFPTVIVSIADQVVGRVNCLAVEERVKARRTATGDDTLMVTEADIEWALENARIDPEGRS